MSIFQLHVPFQCTCKNNQNYSMCMTVPSFLTGGKCEVECTGGTFCREWGQFLCLCNKGKKGTNCEQTDLLSACTSVISITMLLETLEINSRF